jgi:hypothetical protein
MPDPSFIFIKGIRDKSDEELSSIHNVIFEFG